MTQALITLEVFEMGISDETAPLIDSFQADKLREAAYEKGYGAGWQDALAQMRNEDELRNIAAQEALQAISFSYSEAHQVLSDSFLALTYAILETVLPEAMRLVVPVFLAAELDALLARHTQPDVQILCAPSVQDRLAGVVASCPQTNIKMIPEPSFSEGQVSLRIAREERVIDLDDLLDRLREMFGQNQIKYTKQEPAYGRA